jgi:hypothetical protein
MPQIQHWNVELEKEFKEIIIEDSIKIDIYDDPEPGDPSDLM